MTEPRDAEHWPQPAAWVAPLRSWLAEGGLPAKCPDSRLRGQPATEHAEPITLTAEEAAQLSRITGRSVPWQPLLGAEHDHPSARASLLARGVLEVVDGVEVIARAAFPTVGVALLGERTTSVTGPPHSGAKGFRQVAYVRSPGRTVRVETADERTYVVTQATLGEIPAALQAEVGLDHYQGVDSPVGDSRTFEVAGNEPPPAELEHLFGRGAADRLTDRMIEDAFVAADGSTGRVTAMLIAAPDGLWLSQRAAGSPETYRRISVRDAREHLRGVTAADGPAEARWRAEHPGGVAPAAPATSPAPAFAAGDPARPGSAPPWRLIWLAIAAWLVVAAVLAGVYWLTLEPVFLQLGVVVLTPPLVGAALYGRWRMAHGPQQTHVTIRPRGEHETRRP